MGFGRWNWNPASVEELKGRIIKEIKQVGDDELWFTMADGDQYLMYHEQDCCEYVSIEEIIGDLEDLIGEPVLMAEESHEDASDQNDWDSATWTFYKFATIKGYVTIRWYGSSNGYYGETADFVKVPKEEIEEEMGLGLECPNPFLFCK